MFVLGGVRSGKSRYAQAEASRFASVTFVATARRSDAEMRRKIAVHRRERPREWRTVEAHKNLDAVILREGVSADVLLVDCLTTSRRSADAERCLSGRARSPDVCRRRDSDDTRLRISGLE